MFLVYSTPLKLRHLDKFQAMFGRRVLLGQTKNNKIISGVSIHVINRVGQRLKEISSIPAPTQLTSSPEPAAEIKWKKYLTTGNV